MVKFIFLIINMWGCNDAPLDSLRTDTINGRLFIVHQIDPKETLYGISKRYNVSIEQILKFNDRADRGLNIGQILNIPVPVRSPQITSEYHKVQPDETLYSIATLYGMQPEKLKALNKLTGNTVSIGQKLRIKRQTAYDSKAIHGSTTATKVTKGFHKVEQGQTLYYLANLYKTTVKKLKEWNNITGSKLSIGQIIRITNPNTEKTENKKTPTTYSKDKSITISENVIGTNEIRESGLATLIEGAMAERKYLALHHSAPTGSILKIRNVSNNHEIFVRVIGPLTRTDKDKKVIIKISKSAFDRLEGVEDKPLNVELSYYK